MKKLLVVLIIAITFLVATTINAGQKQVSSNGMTVTLEGPNSCSKSKSMTVTVTLSSDTGGGGGSVFTYKVTLREKDKLNDDTIDSQTVDSPMESGAWTKTVTFTFNPKKFEVGKQLELYFIVKGKIIGLPLGGTWTNKSDPLKVKCGK